MTPAPGTPDKRPAWLRNVLLVVAALVAIAVAAWATVTILLPPARVRALVQGQLSTALAREVRFDDARVAIWPPIRVAVRGLALAEPGGFSNGAMFRTRSLDLDLDVLALLSHRVVVRRLGLDQPLLHLALRADGTTNLDGVGAQPKGAAPAKPMDFAVREFGIRRGQVLVDDFGARRRIALALETRVALASAGARFSSSGQTVVTDVAFGPLQATRLADLDHSLARLRWRIEHRGVFDGAQNKLALERLALELGGARVELTGVVAQPGPHAIVDLSTRGSGVEIAPVLGFLAEADAVVLHGIRGAGRLNWDLRVRGRVAPGPPSVTGTVHLAAGAFRYPGAPADVRDLSFTARLAPDSLGIPDLSARVAGQPVRLGLTLVRFADPRVAFTLDGDLDLAAVAPLVAPRAAELRGRAAVRVRGFGRVNAPESMALDGRAALAHVHVNVPTVPKPIDELSGVVDFSQTRAKVSALGAKIGQSSFTLDASVDRPLSLLVDPTRPRSAGGPPLPEPAGLDFDLRSPYLDLAEIMPAGGGAPVLPYARGGGRIAIGRLKNGKLDLERVNAQVTLEPASLVVPSFSAAVYGGITHGSARFEMPDRTRPRASVHAQLDSARVEKLLSAWVPPGNWMLGTLSTSLDLDGDLADLKRSLTATGLATVLDGSLAGQPLFDRLSEFARIPAFRRLTFSEFRSGIKIDRGRVFTGPATLASAQGDWRLSGSIGLDGTLDYAASVTLPKALVEKLSARSALAAGALMDDQGRILMDFKIVGPARAPQIAWDSRAMRDRLAGRASEALAEQQHKVEQLARDTLVSAKRAVEDSARAAAERYRRAAEDSLARHGKDWLKGFFGGGTKDTARK